MYVFGRETEAPHSRIGHVALEWTVHAEASRRAIGWNLRCDHRVSELRAEHFFGVTRQPATSDQMERALIEYKEKWLWHKPKETYLSNSRNGHNFVPKHRLPADLYLVTVINVSRWVRDLSDGSLSDSFKSLTNPASPPELEQTEEFLSELFRHINSERDDRPVWVGRWKEFEAILSQEAAHWASTVGVYPNSGNWLAVLRYPPSIPGLQLIRPTQLDAGYNQYHFPSPPFPRATRGGFAMALRELRPRAPLISEWIHPPINLDVSFWVRDLWGEVLDTTANSVELLRGHHWDRLNRRYSRETAEWLPAEIQRPTRELGT